MFIPPSNFKQKAASNAVKREPIRLKSSHLLIDDEIAGKAFGDCQNVYTVYYPDRNTLMIAPVTDELFKNLHKASQQMLKDRNLKGDKSIALHELLIDNQINETDRDLAYEFQEALGILNVKL
jgi:hypothetical protein